MEDKLILILTTLLFLSSQTLATNPLSCTTPPSSGPGLPLPIPPVIPTLPPVIPTLPPVVPTLPPVIPTLPPVVPTLPPVVPTLPPVIPTLPPVPVVNPPSTKPGCSPPKPKPKPKPKPCPPSGPSKKCPANILKLGACLNVLGGLVHVGDPAVDCCPLIAGLTSAEAALCLCTTIKAQVLGIKVYLPIALQLLVSCGKTPPPGYKCK